MQSIIMSAGETISLHSKCREVNSLWDFTPKALFRLSSVLEVKHRNTLSSLGVLALEKHNLSSLRLVEFCHCMCSVTLLPSWLSWAPQHLAHVYTFTNCLPSHLDYQQGLAKEILTHAFATSTHNTVSSQFSFKNVTQVEKSCNFHAEIQ